MEDEIERFLIPSPCFCLSSGSRGIIKMEFSNETAAFRSVYVMKKLQGSIYREMLTENSMLMVAPGLLHVKCSALIISLPHFPNLSVRETYIAGRVQRKWTSQLAPLVPEKLSFVLCI